MPPERCRRLQEILRDGIEVLHMNGSVGLPREVVRRRVISLLDEGIRLLDEPSPGGPSPRRNGGV